LSGNSIKVRPLAELAAAAVAVKIILFDLITPYGYRLVPEMRCYVSDKLKRGWLSTKLSPAAKVLVAASVPSKPVYAVQFHFVIYIFMWCNIAG